MSSGNLALYDYGVLNGMTTQVEVHYLCSKKYNHKPIEGVMKYPIFKYHSKKGIHKVLSYSISLLKSLKYITREKPDVIHIQWCKAPYIDYIFMKCIRLLNKKSKIVYTAHNVLPHVIKRGDTYIFRKLYKEVDCIITHTKSSRNELIDLCKDVEKKLSVIPHGLIAYDVDEVDVEKIKNELVNNFKLKNKTVFLAIGHQHKSKGTDILLNSWNRTLSNNKECVLVIAGTNTDYEELCTSENILTFSKYLSNEEFNAFLELASVIVLPYRKISQSGVLLSAITLEKPLLVSKVGGLTDPMQYGNVGWSFDISKIDDFEDILMKIAATPNLLEDVQEDKAMWRNVKKEYTWEAIQEKTLNLYKNAISQQ